MTALCDYLEHQVKWHAPDKEGITEYERLGHLIDVPDDPELEQGSEYILQWFWELNAKRQPGFSGLCPLTFADIRAWQQLTGKITRPDEIEALMLMDSAYTNAIHDKRSKEDK